MEVEALRGLPAIAIRKMADDIAQALGMRIETKFTKGDFVEIVGKVQKGGAEKNFVLVLHTGSTLPEEFVTAFKNILKRENAEALVLTTGNVSLELADETLRILSGKALEEFLKAKGIWEEEKKDEVGSPTETYLKAKAEKKAESQSTLPSTATLENYMKLGLKFFEKKEYEKALQYFDEILRLKPEYDRAISLKARVYGAMGKNEVALKIYREALKKMPDKYELWFELADLLHQMERFDEELECYTTILEHNKKLDKVWNNMGIVYFLKEKYEDALFCFERANQLKPNTPDYMNNLATAQKKLRRYEEALANYKKVLEIAPDFSDALLNIGLLYIEMEKYEEAYRTFQKYLRKEKDSAKAWHLAGIAAMNAGAYSQAIECFEEALKINSELKEAREGLKEAKRKYLQKGDKQKISEGEDAMLLGGGIIKPAVVEEPKEEKEKQELVVESREAVPSTPEIKVPKSGLAALVSAIAKEVERKEEAPTPEIVSDCWSLVKRGKFEEAARRLERIEMKKNLAVAVVCGYAFAGASRFTQALECFETVLSQQKMHLPALFGKEFAESSLGNYDEALKTIDLLSKKFPGNRTIALKKCLLLFAKGEVDKCDVELKKIAKENQQSEIYWFILGSVNLRKGQRENAIKCFENALKINPGFDAARKKIEELRK